MDVMRILFSAGTFAATLRIMATVAFASLGTVLATRSGIMHMGQEGLMLITALAGVAGTFYSGSMLVGVLVAVAAGIAFNLLYYLFTVIFKGDHIVIGIGFNFFANGLTATLIMVFWGRAGTSENIGTLNKVDVPFLKGIPFLDEIISNQNILFYVLIIAIIALWFLIYKTPFGLRMRICGELPMAVACTGHSVRGIRAICSILGGVLFALSGVSITMGQTAVFTKNMMNGRGFVALAMCMLGRNNPVLASLACLMYGYTEALQLRMQGSAIPNEYVQCIPYLFAIVVIAISGSLRNPAALGKPFPEEER